MYEPLAELPHAKTVRWIGRKPGPVRRGGSRNFKHAPYYCKRVRKRRLAWNCCKCNRKHEVDGTKYAMGGIIAFQDICEGCLEVQWVDVPQRG